MLFSNTVSLFGCLIFFLVLKYEIKPDVRDIKKYLLHTITLNILFWVVYFLPTGFLPPIADYLFFFMSIILGTSTLVLGIHYHALYENGVDLS